MPQLNEREQGGAVVEKLEGGVLVVNSYGIFFKSGCSLWRDT